MNTAEIVYERVKNLPEPLALEVLDFVNFITLKKELADKGRTSLSEEETEFAIGEMLKVADKATKP